MLRLFLFLGVLGFLSCKSDSKVNPGQSVHGEVIPLSYAENFSLTDHDGYTILDIHDPWPDSDRSFRFILAKDLQPIPKDLLNNSDGLIEVPVKKIVVTSTTHIPALDLLEQQHSLVGFPGTAYISSPAIRDRIDSDQVRELGKNEEINTEILLEVNPNVVIGFGIDGNSKSYQKIEKSGIPVIYNGDWTEKSPLAKAEWLKFFGALFDKSREADSVFKRIESDYKAAAKLASKVSSRPTVLSGAMHKDVWYLPYGTSPEAQMLHDANVNYLWADTRGNGSLALNFEAVYSKAKDADIWISPSNFPSLEALENTNPHYASFKAFREGSIYSFNNTRGKTGGTLYFELGTTRPDLVLKDLIKICHPELLSDYQPFFFKPLN